MDEDILYHLALGSSSNDLASMFGDVKVSGNQLQRINSMRALGSGAANTLQDIKELKVKNIQEFYVINDILRGVKDSFRDQ